MNKVCRIVLFTSALAAPDTLCAQQLIPPDQSPSRKVVSIGYNTFGEFYLGGEFPRKSQNKVSVQAGYQAAVANGMTYATGPFEMPNPFLTNNCKGIRMRAGVLFFDNRGRRYTFFLETHQLESNPFLNQDYSGSSSVPIIYFTETYQKYGVRFMKAIPIGGSETVFFTYSIGILYSKAHRTYLSSSTGTLPPDSGRSFTTPQFTIGLQFLLF